MSEVQRRIAGTVLDALDRVAFMTVAQLSRLAGVSEASVVRFVRFLGFEKYQDFKAALSDRVMERLSTTERSRDISHLSSKGLYASMLKREIDALISAHDDLNEAQIDVLGTAIAQAPAVYICSARSSYTLGYYMSFFLSWFLPQVSILDQTNTYEELCMAPKGSLVIGISFPRYTRWTIETLSFAHDMGLTVASLTNDLGSPLAEYSKYTLVVPYRQVSFIDSFTVPVSVANCLILSVFRAVGEDARAHLAELEEVWRKHDVYKN